MVEKLEKKFGKFAIKNLIYYILGGYVVGYVLMYVNDGALYQYITLSPSLVMQGQVWRLFTWILTPPQTLSIWVIFMFLFYYYVGKGLEQTLGSFRYNLYIFSGWFFMTFGSMILYWVTAAVSGTSGAISLNASTYYINLTSFLAFAVLYPDYKVYLFGIIPLKMKWLAIFDIAYMGLEVLSSVVLLIAYALDLSVFYEAISVYGYSESTVVMISVAEIFSIVIAMLNFIIFYICNRDFKRYSYKEVKRRREFKKGVEQGRRENASYSQAAGQNKEASQSRSAAYRPSGGGVVVHKCEVCGRTSLTNPELQFRYCSKCSGNHEYCQDHIFTHEHIK